MPTPSQPRDGLRGVTEHTEAGDTYAAQVVFVFEARDALSYQCDPGVTTHIQIAVGSARPYPHIARAGERIECAGPQMFGKVKEGWVMYFGAPGLGGAYLLKR